MRRPRKPGHSLSSAQTGTPSFSVAPRRGPQQARSAQRHRCAVHTLSISHSLPWPRSLRTAAARGEKKSVADPHLSLDGVTSHRMPERERTGDRLAIGCASSCGRRRRLHATGSGRTMTFHPRCPPNRGPSRERHCCRREKGIRSCSHIRYSSSEAPGLSTHRQMVRSQNGLSSGDSAS